ncbi:MAG TPA: CheR family methyltransferase [Casimicrobiaceae bacterium]|nr:CheR family methyltransferase [Casimicrobiaceae bacterium]
MKAPEKDRAFESLLDYLKESRGFDFTGYKRSSLMRRVIKRMSELPKIKGYGAYQDYLEVHPEEFAPLFNTILINVTSFFRDPATWEYLAEDVIPRIIAGKKPGDSIRVCSVGCASGEEAYSAAMLLAEALGDRAFRDRVKIYATDVDNEALAEARHGAYPVKRIAAVPDKLRKKFFNDGNDGVATVRSDLRHAVIFGRHDLIQDAPISRLDLLICRNTLMYFNAETQAHILPRFDFALVEGGFLFLGKSEMLLTHGDAFNVVSLKHRVFSKVARTIMRDRLLMLARADDGEATNHLGRHLHLREAAFDTVPIAQLVIDFNGRLVLASSEARNLFGLTANDVGRPLQDLEISYRPAELRSMIQQAYAERKPVAAMNVRQTLGGGESRYFDIKVVPLQMNGDQPIGVAVSFENMTHGNALRATLQRANEELETANEELQATNEELETTNEELQSTNEELETTNEELQSTNEELETTNDELQLRTDEVNRTNAFLNAVLGGLRTGVAILDRNFSVLGWNPQAEKLWELSADEVRGQSIFALDTGLSLGALRTTLRACLNGEPHEEHTLVDATTRGGRNIQCRVTCRAYSAPAGKPGVVVFMEEVA